jgi:hypothetical protein
LNDPKEVLFQEVINGNFDAREYAHLKDLFTAFDVSEEKTYKACYATNSQHAAIVHNVLFLEEPDNLEEVNANRKAIYMAETWEDYKTKILHAFYNKSPYFRFAMLQHVGFGDDEENIQKANEMKEEINNEHKAGNYKRTYYEK